MRWRKTIWATGAVALLLAMGLAGCNSPTGGNPSGQEPGQEPAPEKRALNAPENLGIAKDTFNLSWSVVPNAASYKVVINDTLEHAVNSGTSFHLGIEDSIALTTDDLHSEPDLHSVKVMALAASDDEVYTNSAYSASHYFETAHYVFHYTTDGDKHTITGYTAHGATLQHIVIPHKIGGVEVAEIGEGAFEDHGELVTIHIPHTVTAVGDGAFSGNTSLTDVHFYRGEEDHDGATELGDSVFEGCESLENIHVPHYSKDHYENAHGHETATVQHPAVTGVALDKDTLTLNGADSAETLAATVTPSRANQNVSWSSSNESVATVADGVVTAVGPGTATITVSTEDGDFTAECSVTVTMPVTGVTLDKTTLEFIGTGSQALVATVLPANASNKNVTWRTSNVTVASVSDTGLVNANSVGSATITCTTVDGGFTATCTVTVKAVAVTDVELEPETLELNGPAGTQGTLVATVLPANATNKSVTWSSADESVATVAGGVVTSVGSGTTTITVTTTDGEKTATCSITVIIPVTGVELDSPTLAMTVGGEDKTLVATVLPVNATNKNVTWSSDDENVATVADGVVTAVAEGTATITVSTVDGEKTATCTVTVTIAVSGVELDNDELELIGSGSTETLVATVLPVNATNKNVTWSSSNTGVATVANGVVTSVADGTAIITVTTEDGEFTATCEVTVKPVPVDSVSLNEATLSLVRLETETLSATVLPENATHKTVTWSSSDDGIATVSSTGLVTAVGVGMVTITVTTTEGGKTDTCEVTVTPVLVTGVTLNKANVGLVIGHDETLIATIAPATADDQSVSWSSSNPGIATVDANGKVTADSSNTGKATITVTTNDGSFTDTCEVTVTLAAVESVSLNKPSISLFIGSEDDTLVATVLPANANQAVTWASSNDNVEVDANGKITAVKVGSAIITVTTEEGGFIATCNVTVNPIAVSNVTLNKSTLAFTGSGSSETLIATVEPANATNKNVSWTSSNQTVASVDANGLVTALSSGTTTITVRTIDGNKTATCSVTVTIPVSGVSLDQTSFEATVGDAPVTLIATVAPANASNKNVSWSTSNAAVATVANGTVTAVGPGTAIITVTTDDGSLTDTCTVAVRSQTGTPTINILTLTPQDITAPVVSGSTLLYKGDSLAMTSPAGYTPVTWSVNGSPQQTGGSSYTFTTGNKAAGQYIVSLMAEKGGKYYNVNITVTIMEKTGGMAGITINYLWVKNGDVTAEATAITVPKGQAVVISKIGEYTPLAWSVNGSPMQTGGDTYTFSALNRVAGLYTVGLVAEKDGRSYNVNITVTVTN